MPVEPTKPKWQRHHTAASIILVAAVFAATVVGSVAGSTITRPKVADLAVQQLVTAKDVSYLLAKGGQVYSQGLNNFGQLGNGTMQDSSSWSRVSFVKDGQQPKITKLSTDGDHTLALDSTGVLWTWGNNSYSALGNGSSNPEVSPTRVSVSYSFSKIVAGDDFVVALDSRGSLYTWGQNGTGQLGNDSTKAAANPTIIGTSHYTDVAAGKDFAFAIDSAGALWAWGSNSEGQFGNGNTKSSSVPLLISAGPWSSVSASRISTTMAAINASGNLYTWGSNSNALLGTGRDWRGEQAAENARVASEIAAIQAADAKRRQGMVDTLTAAKLAELRAAWTPTHDAWVVKQKQWVVANPEPVQADYVDSDNNPDVAAFTTAHDAWLASQKTWNTANPEPIAPTDIPPADKAAIDAQVTASFVKTDTSHIVAATISEPTIGKDSPTPQLVPSPAKFKTVSIGTENGAALDTGGHLWTWGNDKNGQTGLSLDETTHTHRPVMVGTATYTDVYVGDRWAVAGGSSGLYTWGLNTKSNALQSGEAKLTSPTKIHPGSFKQVAGNAITGGAIQTNGSAVTWGSNDSGITGQGVDSANTALKQIDGQFSEITFSQNAALAVGTGVGDLYFWGSDKDRLSAASVQIRGSSLKPLRHSISNFLDIATGRLSTYVVDSNGLVWAWGLMWMGSFSDKPVQVTIPTRVPLAEKVSKISASQTDVLVLTTEGKLSWWGSHSPGFGVIPVTLPSDKAIIEVSQMASGKNHFLILGKKGEVWSLSTTYDPAQLADQIPGSLVKVDLAGDAQSVSAGGSSSIAVLNGVAYGWGNNSAMNLDPSHAGNILAPRKLPGPSAGEWKSLAVSGTHTLGVSNQGVLYNWGHSKYISGLERAPKNPLHSTITLEGN